MGLSRADPFRRRSVKLRPTNAPPKFGMVSGTGLSRADRFCRRTMKLRPRRGWSENHALNNCCRTVVVAANSRSNSRSDGGVGLLIFVGVAISHDKMLFSGDAQNLSHDFPNTLLASLHPDAARYNNRRQNSFHRQVGLANHQAMVERARRTVKWSLRVGRGKKRAPIKGRRIAPKLLQ